MVIKPKLNREVKIGLSVLLLLFLILAGVIVRRFMRAAPLDGDIAMTEVRHAENRPEEHRKREADAFPKPVVVTPIETPHRDDLRAFDDPGQMRIESKERKKEAESMSASGLLAADPPPKIRERDETAGRSGLAMQARTTTGPTSSALDAGLAASSYADDRYSVARQEHPAEHPKRESESMVIQVSGGELNDGKPRPLDRYSPGRDAVQPAQFGSGERSREAIPPAPIVNETIPPADGRFSRRSGDSDAERGREKVRSGEVPAPRGNYMPEPVAGDARNNYNPNWQQPASYPNSPDRGYNSNPGYSAAPSAFTSEHAPHPGHEEHEEFGRMRSQTPLHDDSTYEVQPNDSYWTISERVYGSGAYFRALAEQNRGKAARPDRLSPGLVISTPPVTRLEKDYPDLCPRPNRREAMRNRAAIATMASTAGGGRTYVVQEGDTLSSIARNELGKVSRWADIYQLNRETLGKDYDYLTPGMRLVLPLREGPSGDRTTRRGEDGGPLSR
jgi:nucleoid-associated protein YgaU